MHDLGDSATIAFTGDVRARVQRGPACGVLWVHGYTLDSTVWNGIWSHLPGWTHYGVDLPGHGASPAAWPGRSLSEIGLRLAEAAASREIEHVVGLSLGSVIALEIALSLPAAFDTLTMAAPAVAGGPVERDVGVRYGELVELYHQRGAGPWMTELWMRDPPATFAHADAALRARLAGVIHRHRWSELEEPASGLGALVREPQDLTRLPHSTARLLCIVGEHELPAFRRTAALLRTCRPDAAFAHLAGAGHLCVLHAPEAAAAHLAAHWGAATCRSSLTGPTAPS